ncbi:MAG: hypothetical protein M3162_08855 [Thermoproteota archaeon]|nr:hypothetical protein [Thermoproteota archaeon]
MIMTGRYAVKWYRFFPSIGVFYLTPVAPGIVFYEDGLCQYCYSKKTKAVKRCKAGSIDIPK